MAKQSNKDSREFQRLLDLNNQDLEVELFASLEQDQGITEVAQFMLDSESPQTEPPQRRSEIASVTPRERRRLFKKAFTSVVSSGQSSLKKVICEMGHYCQISRKFAGEAKVLAVLSGAMVKTVSITVIVMGSPIAVHLALTPIFLVYLSRNYPFDKLCKCSK